MITIINNKTIVISSKAITFFDKYILLIYDEINIKVGS